MKKVLFAALAATCFLGFQSVADAAINGQQDTTMAVPAQKEKIDVNQLPDAVKKTLASDAFKGTEVVSAYLVKNGDKNIYEVTIRKDGKDAVVNIDENGNIVS